MTDTFGASLQQLPVPVAPRLGENTDSYIRRLARANHLKPSYLHTFLSGPPFWFGKPRLDRLSTVSGRTPEVLHRALVDASSPRLRYKPMPGRFERKCRDQLPRYVEHQIQQQAMEGAVPLRTLAHRHGVSKRLVHYFLDNPPQPFEERPVRGPAVITRFQHLIDPLIASGLNTREIWCELMDTHNTSISYGTLNGDMGKKRKEDRRREARNARITAARSR
ncbi:hypothetical protein [Streptomyces sp. NPDC093984]|uniref:hypothetical protein n=1 Tax=Streptomyces sp. NPDC093984 TaxID=3366052 RepID=UPI003815A36D